MTRSHGVARPADAGLGDPEGSRITIARKMYAMRLGECSRTRASTL